MASNLSDLLNFGKKAIAGLSLIALAACSMGFQARKDYGFDPIQRKQIALYNITNILKGNCKKSEVDNHSLYCFRDNCLSWKTGYNTDHLSGQRTSSFTYCSFWGAPLGKHIYFNEIKSIIDNSVGCMTKLI